MVVELLKRERGSRKLIPSGITFGSITEAAEYYADYVGERLSPCPDMIGGYFKILDSNEIFCVCISWDNSKEVCWSVSFEGLDKEM